MTDAYGAIGSGAIAEFAIAETGGGAPSLLDTLRAGDFTIVIIQEMKTAGSPLIYRMYLSTGDYSTNPDEPQSAWTTLPTDSLPNVTLGGEIHDGPVVNGTFAFSPGAQNNGEQSGEVTLLVHPDGVPVETVGYGVVYQGLTQIRLEKLVGGSITTIKVGYPRFGLDSFHTVWTGVGDDLKQDGLTLAKLTFRDNRAALSQGVLSTFAGTGDSEGTSTNTGALKPRHYGAPSNVSPVLIDAVNLTYFCSDRAASVALPAAYDGAAALTVDSTSLTTYAALKAHSVASGSWAQARVAGVGTFVKLGATPSKRFTVDFADVLTVPQIIRAVLEDAGIPSSRIIIPAETYPFGTGTDRSADWQAIQNTIQNNAAGYQYISQQMTPNDIVDALCKSVGLSRYLDDTGRENFEAPDYVLNDAAVSGTDYTILSAGSATTITNADGSQYVEFAGGDILSIRELDPPSSMWPPDGRKRLRADSNHSLFTETDVLAGADDARRQYVLKAGNDLTVESPSDIFSALKNAVDPDPLDTHISDAIYLPALGAWLLKTSALSDGRGAPVLYLTKRRFFEIELPMTAYATIPALRTVKFSHPSFYGDAPLNVIGQAFPVETDWKALTRKYYVYAQSQQYSSLPIARISGGDLDGVSIIADNGNVFIGTPSNITAVSLSDINAPAVLDTLSLGGASAFGLAKSSDYIFSVSPGTDELMSVDASDPASLSIADSTAGPSPGTSINRPQTVQVQDSHAFIPCYDGARLAVVDVTNPASLTWATEVQGPLAGTSLANAIDLSLSTSRAYVLCAGSKKQSVGIVDITSPASSAWVGEFTAASLGTTWNGARKIAGTLTHLFILAADDKAIVALKKDDDNTLSYAGSFSSDYLENAKSIYLRGSYMYVCGWMEGLLTLVLDISDPSSIRTVSVVRDNFAYGSAITGDASAVYVTSDVSIKLMVIA